MTTSNHDLEARLACYKKFLGVFSIDTIPKKWKLGDAFITNIEPSSKGGSHWVCMLNDGLGFYIDPFGLPAPEEIIKLSPRHHANHIQYQSVNSKRCGMYCVYFVKHFLEGTPVYDMLYKHLTPHASKINDDLVLKEYLRARCYHEQIGSRA